MKLRTYASPKQQKRKTKIDFAKKKFAEYFSEKGNYLGNKSDYRRACQPAVNVADRKLAGWGKSQVERLYYSSKVADGQSS